MRRPRIPDEQRRDPVVRAVEGPGRDDDPGAASRLPGRRKVPAGRALSVMLICLFVWLLLNAPALKRAAEASEIGARRSAALAVLGPLAGLSEVLQLDHARNAISTVIGRDPDEQPGVAAIDPVPITAPSGTEGDDEQAGAEAPIPVPTRGDPLRVVVIGDSFATGVGAAIGRSLNPRLVDVQARGVISTGLTRPDYFNWQPNLREIVDRFRPGVVVVMLGGNDAQTLTVPGGRPVPLSAQEEWRRIYSERVESLAETATDAGARMVWIGLPPMRDINRDHQAHRLDDIYRAVAKTSPGVAYVNSLDLFARPGGGYAAYLPDADGDERLVREGDGEHFTTLGYDWVADAVLRALEKHWDLPADAVER
jgi:uncharacterized protein